MSGAITGLATAGTFALPFTQMAANAGLLPAFIRAPRSIGTIIPDVMIEERHSDRMTITAHPVADNTPVSDHAFMLPQTCVIRAGWTNANPLVGAVQGLISGGDPFGAFTETRAKDIYNQLLALQQRRQPFELTTGKRTYQNMLISELSVGTDRTKEYSLIIEAHCQQVIIVTTATTAQPAQNVQKAPQQTSPTIDSGQQTPQPVANPDSLLKRLGTWAGSWLS